MPIIHESSYIRRPWLQFNAWLETLVPYYASQPARVAYERERLELADGDFVDLDWVRNGAKTLMIVSHGFEGNSKDHFIEEVCSCFNQYDFLVWHYRSCSGEVNRLPRFYHQGDIEDLDSVIKHATSDRSYDRVILLGFSMGGNLVINYLGSKLEDDNVQCGIVFSTPMSLSQSAKKLHAALGGLVEKSFVKKWKRKIEQKAKIQPELFNLQKLQEINDLQELLAEFVLPHHGFKDLNEFYALWSSDQFLLNIEVPLLIVNAKNDPLLSSSCYPVEICEKSQYVFLETPKYGGHIGFDLRTDGIPWYAHRIRDFLNQHPVS